MNTILESMMAQAISASEANQHFSRMLRDVLRGESFIVMSRGRAVARVGPVNEAETSQPVEQLLAFLEAQPRRDAGCWIRDDLYR